MKYLLLVCGDAERMNAQEEPASRAAPVGAEEPFPWGDDLVARGIRLTGATESSAPSVLVPTARTGSPGSRLDLPRAVD